MDDHTQRNRAYWTGINSAYTDSEAEKDWAQEQITWGVFQVPESQLDLIGDVRGQDVVELGCGTAYFSSWLMRRGARPVGVDVTPAQLASARRCQEKFGLSFPLVEASAERVPLPDASFDLALSEHGASLWCEPERWLAEASRLLRPNGRLVFMTTSTILTLCIPDEAELAAGTTLLRGVRDIRTVNWADGSTEFHPSHGEWIALLRKYSFCVDRLEEVYAPPGAEEHSFYKLASVEWSQRWPVEEIWVARKSDR
jgi:ubiquinone/menaquinone biosynthesis C-methylase UbiE